MSTRRRKQPAKKQPCITEHALPLLKKPLEQIGKQINVPGSFWYVVLQNVSRQRAESRERVRLRVTGCYSLLMSITHCS